MSATSTVEYVVVPPSGGHPERLPANAYEEALKRINEGCRVWCVTTVYEELTR
jgi:hypothetical protein